MSVSTIADYKPLFALARKRGVKVYAVVVHPASIHELVKSIAALGDNPYPYVRRTWKRLWRKPDMRPHLFGVPVALNSAIPAGLVGCATLSPMPPDLAEMFSGDLNLLPSPTSLPVQPEPEKGALQMLADSVNVNDATLSDLMVKAMDGMDGATGVVVLRFWGDMFDVTTNFNPLECQAVLQRSAMRVMSEGLQG